MDDRAVLGGGAGQLPRQRQGVDMAARAVAETAEEEVRADTAVELRLVDQLDLGPVLLPLPEAVLRDRPGNAPCAG